MDLSMEDQQLDSSGVAVAAAEVHVPMSVV
jgi:hypothetical protein